MVTTHHVGRDEYDVQYDSGDVSLRLERRRLHPATSGLVEVGSREKVHRQGALDRWQYAVKRAGRDEDAAVEAARQGLNQEKLRRRRSRAEITLTIDGMVPLAQEVIHKGFTFLIDDECGKPHALVPERVGLKLQHHALLEEMRVLGR